MVNYPKIGGEREHRLVWAEDNGPIPDGHVVHHRNGVKDDNRLENLELMTAAEHNRAHFSSRQQAGFGDGSVWRGKKQPADLVAKRVAATKETWAKNGRKRPAYLDENRCRRGHDLSLDTNRYVRSSGRVNCRECKRLLDRGVV